MKNKFRNPKNGRFASTSTKDQCIVDTTGPGNAWLRVEAIIGRPVTPWEREQYRPDDMIEVAAKEKRDFEAYCKQQEKRIEKERVKRNAKRREMQIAKGGNLTHNPFAVLANS